MKFNSIKIKNFMRYKGENEIIFSCDDEKNVTIVMGNNTSGKTTLAQAFRWGLYGEIIDTRYVKSKDMIILNKDVIADMKGTIQEEEVFVELVIEEGNMKYCFRRQEKFTRNFPNMTVKRISSKLMMKIKEGDNCWGDWVDNDSTNRNEQGSVDEQIKIMFPKNLSSYFFFDGERWSDEKNTNREIKESIGTLMGIVPLVKMRDHLYNGNGKSVLKKLRNSITGSGIDYENTRRELEKCEANINKWKKEIKEEENNIIEFSEKIRKAEEYLESNKKIEQYQNDYRKLKKSLDRGEKHIEEIKSDIVKSFSRDGYKYFASFLLDDVVDLLKSVDMNGKDIPNITEKTIDYLLNKSECICGNCIGEKEKKCLEDLKKYIYPNVIGPYIGNFQKQIENFRRETKDILNDLTEKATKLESVKAQLEDDQDEIYKIEKIIDNKVNFSAERKKLNLNKEYKEKSEKICQQKNYNIEQTEERIKVLNGNLEREAAHTEENRRIQRMIKYAEELYNTVLQILKDKEEPLFDELNIIIKKNFEEMFHEKDKYAQMGEDYKLHLFYNSIGSLNNGEEVEEKSLSEGEIIARNFVFIVSILELAQKKKKEELENGDSDVLELPLVLDGPFSKLGDDNTELIAKVLPKAAEQVIIFMLDKDWNASGLEKYTLPEYRYRVNKDINSNSSVIEGGK